MGRDDQDEMISLGKTARIVDLKALFLLNKEIPRDVRGIHAPSIRVSVSEQIAESL